MILDATTKSLELVLAAASAATDLPYFASYADHTSSALTPGQNDGTTNDTTAVTAVAAPGSSTQREVLELHVYNADSQISTVKVQLNNNSTLRIVYQCELFPGDSLHYNRQHGWTITDKSGCLRTQDNFSHVASLGCLYHVGGGGAIEANYVAGLVNSTALTTKAMSANSLFAAPFVWPQRAANLDRIAVYVTTGVASSTVRLGVYDATSDVNLYPNALLFGSGTLSTATTSSIASATPNISGVPGRLYWAVLNSSSTATLRAVAVAGAAPIFGLPNTISGTAPQTCIDSTETYAALASTFPASKAAGTSTYPAIFLRFSA